MDVDEIILNELYERFPDIKATWATCPACEEDNVEYYSYLDSVIIHINDIHKWERSAIADWLDDSNYIIMES